MKIEYQIASHKDHNLLIEHFKHYNDPIVQKNRVECYSSHNTTLMMFIGGVFGGSIQWYRKEDPNMGVVELEEFYIKKQFRNQGFGTKLFNKALIEIQNTIQPIFCVFLFINKTNQTMKHICETSGFKEVAEIPNMFKLNETELLFLKHFSA